MYIFRDSPFFMMANFLKLSSLVMEDMVLTYYACLEVTRKFYNNCLNTHTGKTFLKKVSRLYECHVRWPIKYVGHMVNDT